MPTREFMSKDEESTLMVAVGDTVEVVLETVENGFGETCLSREKAIHAAMWNKLQQSFDDEEVVEGVICDKVRGGFTVAVESLRAFLPGSLVDIRPVRDISHLEGQVLSFKIVKMDERRNNIVLSRRAVIEQETSSEREEAIKSIQEGNQVQGIVKNVTDYGAFVDLGGIDGLLHITDISWKRVKHPGEVLTMGDEITVKVLQFDREKNRVSQPQAINDDPGMSSADARFKHVSSVK